MRWNINTEYIANKASSLLGYVRRTIPLSLPHLRARAYTTIGRPITEYSSVWDGALTKTQTNSIESIQRKAARTAGLHNIPRTDHTTRTTALTE